MILFLNIKMEEYEKKMNLRIDSLKSKMDELKLTVEKLISDTS